MIVSVILHQKSLLLTAWDLYIQSPRLIKTSFLLTPKDSNKIKSCLNYYHVLGNLELTLKMISCLLNILNW